MRIAALQLAITWENPQDNFTRIAPWLAAAAAQKARLVTLPETFACGFSMKTERVAEPPGGATEQFLTAQARTHDLWLVGSVPERTVDDAKPHNTLLVVGPDGTVHRYRKQKPFTFGGEARAYAAGNRDLTVTIEGLRLTFFVCYDLRFADLFWRRAPETDAYIVIANWPETRRAHWNALLQARAIENQAFVIGTNRVGEGGGLRYAGDSVIVDPMGTRIAAAADQEALLVADVDPNVVRDVRSALPFMDDR